jgi:putative membrane protein
MIRLRIAFISAAAVFCVLCAFAELSRAASESKGEDAVFLQQAVNNVSWLATLGEMAEKQAASDGIRRYGEITSAHYHKQTDELHRLAAQNNIPLFPDMNTARRNTVAYFSQKSGAEFDRNYISLMVEENESQAAVCRKYAQAGSDAAVKFYAHINIDVYEAFAKEARRLLLALPKPVLK